MTADPAPGEGKLPTLLFFGDSHLRPMMAAFADGEFGGYHCSFVAVGGATAVGLRHPTSKTLALERFRERLLPLRQGIVPIFHLGEVDCGFVIWHRAQKYGESVEVQLEQSLEAYGAFLLQCFEAGYGNMLVTAATLPTIRDGALEGEVALLRAQIQATQRQRTDLTLAYNSRLGDFCRLHGIDFLDLSAHFMDPASRLLDDSFRHPDPKDHHLHPQTGGKLWAQQILRVVSAR
jgi:hypothetical protein